MKIKNSKLKIKKIWLLFVFSSAVIWVWGCARTVTLPFSPEAQMSVEVTLGGTLESSANRYFLILSENSSFKIPYLLDQDLSTPEFIEPGMTPLIGKAIDYYTKYYSTWAGYVILDRDIFYSERGPFIFGQAASREIVSSLGSRDTKIKFTLNLRRIFDVIPDTIYFDFVSVPWPDGAQKIPADHINSTDAYISKAIGSIKSVDDLIDPQLDPALDIRNCRVEIQ